MFGIGITEILLIAIVAIIVLGPDKLPDAMIQIAKLFNSVKKSLNDAKTTLDNELNINELKNEANKFKAQIEDTAKLDLGLDEILNDDLENSKPKDEKDFIERKKEITKAKQKKNSANNKDKQ